MLLRKTTLLLAFFLLSACGFQPMYGEHSAAKVAAPALQTVRLSGIEVAETPVINGVRIGDRLRQQFSNKLIDRMYTNGYPENPKLELTINVEATERETGIQKDATATRAELIMVGEMILRQSGTFEEVYRTKARTRVAYNILDAQYGTMVAKENAYDRALDTLADDVVRRLSLFLSRKNGIGAGAAPGDTE